MMLPSLGRRTEPEASLCRPRPREEVVDRGVLGVGAMVYGGLRKRSENDDIDDGSKEGGVGLSASQGGGEGKRLEAEIGKQALEIKC